METIPVQPEGRPVISPLAPAMQNQSSPVGRIISNPVNPTSGLVRIPEGGILNIMYSVTNGDPTGIQVQVWLPTKSEILEIDKLYRFPVSPDAAIYYTYTSEYDQVDIQFFISPS